VGATLVAIGTCLAATPFGWFYRYTASLAFRHQGGSHLCFVGFSLVWWGGCYEALSG